MTARSRNKPPGAGSRLAEEDTPPEIHAGMTGGLGASGGIADKRRNDLAPTLKFEMAKVCDLKPAHHPVRQPSTRQVARATQSIRRFGFRDPVLLGTGLKIIDGHVRVEAARKLGLAEIPCIIADDLSEEEIRLLRIALNRIQERGEWDEAGLKLEFSFLLEFEPDLSVTGFDAPEIDRILVLDDLGPEEANPLDEVGRLPSPDADAVTRPGDIWQLGANRIICGNARNIEDVRSVAGNERVAVVFTDPPYNVAVNGHVRVGSGKFAEFLEASGEMSEVEYEEFLRITIGNMAAAVKPGGVLFLCIDWRHVETLMGVIRALSLELLNLCVWAKDKPGMGSFYRSQHELVVVAKRPGAQHLNNIQLGIYGRNRTNLWRYAGATGGRKSDDDDFSLHPTVKPVRLVRDAILDVTSMGEVIFDPFLGSGTTVLAAELSKRVCVGMEISPAYVDVAIRRWEKLTGLDAVHSETGMTFAELCDAHASTDYGGEAIGPDPEDSGPPSEEDF